MKPRCYVGIDTSNYTTSAAVCSDCGEVIANIKAPLPVKEGACGLRQSDAVFAHVKNLPCVMEQLRDVLRDYEVAAVGCSSRPRPVSDSYMPCFLAGVAAARSLTAPLEVPVFDFSHQEGHIMAAAYSSGQLDNLTKAPFAAFHVSGGTTEILHVTPEACGFAVELVGETADLNAGQAIDRVGVMMGLRFPCGREMEAFANSYKGNIQKPRISVKGTVCNLSGLQNLSEALWEQTGDVAAVSAYVFSFIGETLHRMTIALNERYPEIPILYAGGVMSNRILQKILGDRPNTYFAEPQFSADNAAGISLLCRKQFLTM